MAMWGKTFQLRTKELANAIVFDPTRDQPYWASINANIMEINRAHRKDPKIGEKMKTVKRMRDQLNEDKRIFQLRVEKQAKNEVKNFKRMQTQKTKTLLEMGD